MSLARAVLLAVGLTLAFAAPAWATTPGDLVQLPAPNDCVSASSTLASEPLEGCSVTGAHGLLGADAVAISPDGTSVYVAAGDAYPGPVEDDALARFDRVPATGAVTEANCVGETLDNCDTKTDGMLAPDDVKVSPDGARVYVASDISGVTVFKRAADGSLTPAGCFKDPGDSSDPSCTATTGFQFGGARGLAVSPDSQFVYAATQNGNAIAEFKRTAGSLTYLGCVSGGTGANTTCSTDTDVGLLGVTALALSPSGDRLYAVSYAGNALDVFGRDRVTGMLTSEIGCLSLKTGGGETACSDNTVPGLGNTQDVAVSADGSHVYTVSLDGAVASFSTMAAAPGVSPLGCIGAAPPAAPTPGCASNGGVGLQGAAQIALVPDAAPGTVAAYVTGFFDDAVAELEIAPGTGELVPLPAPDGCVVGVSSGSSCNGPLAHGLQDADGIAVSPDGNDVYIASRGAGETRSGCGGTCTDTIAALAAFSRFTPAPPVVSTSAASAISQSSATLNGQVNPRGDDTTYRFELSTNLAFGSFISLPSADAGAGTFPVGVSASATGLSAATVYYYRLVASNSAGSATSSPPQQFTTLSPPSQSTTVRLGDQQITLTTPSPLACISNSGKLAVTLKSVKIPKSKLAKLKFSSAAFYIDKGVKHKLHKKVRARNGKTKRVVVTVYKANAITHHLPVTLELSLARLRPGTHTLKVVVSYKETTKTHGHKKTETVTKTMKMKFTVC